MKDSQAKSLEIIPYCGVTDRDDKGRVRKVLTPSSPEFGEKRRGAPRFASVTLDRTGKVITLSCVQHGLSDSDEGTPCPASNPPAGRKAYLCYHCRAALQIAAVDAGNRLEIHTHRDYAEKAVEKHGAGWCLTVQVGRATAFAALLPRAKTAPAKAKPGEQCPCGNALNADQLESGLCSRCDRSFAASKR